MITIESITFFVFALMAISGAVMMINLQKVMHMALALAFTFLSIAGLYFLLNAEFLAVIQILIYAGAISILMLFGIMLTKHEDEEKQGSFLNSTLCFLSVAGLLCMLLYVIYQIPLVDPSGAEQDFSVSKLGTLLFKQYVIPFEALSILLLVALVGSVMLARKEQK